MVRMGLQESGSNSNSCRHSNLPIGLLSHAFDSIPTTKGVCLFLLICILESCTVGDGLVRMWLLLSVTPVLVMQSSFMCQVNICMGDHQQTGKTR